MSSSTLARHPRLHRLVGQPWFWLSWILLWAAVPITRAVLTRLPPPLPVLAELPRFSFQSQDAAPFGSTELAGKPWVANFIFTRCPTICPLFTEKMAKLERRTSQLGEHIHFVSFSVDPAYDQPAVLKQYATAHHANLRRWTFLTGDPEAIRATVVGGLKIAMGTDPGADLGIFHGTQFVLVDGQGRIRGYYDSSDDGAQDRLVRDLGLLTSGG